MSNKPLLLVICIIMILISCAENKDKDNIIEFYLLKNRPFIKEGISFEEFSKRLNVNIDDYADLNTDITRYDTVSNEFIYAGKFEPNKKYLTENPFIKNNEILGFDSIKNTFYFSEGASKRINSLIIDARYGEPFIICENGTPIFSGYFISQFSSNQSTWFCINFDPSMKVYEKYTAHALFKGNGINGVKDYEMEQREDLDKLLKALKKANKLNFMNLDDINKR